MKIFSKKHFQIFSFTAIRRMLLRWSIIIMLTTGGVTALLFSLVYLCGINDLIGRDGFALAWSCIILCIVVGVILSIPLTSLVIKPIKDLNNAIEKVIEGDLEVKVDVKKGPREIVEILENFNRMVRELSEDEIFKRDFINNFSHEFKTPIMSIKGFAKQLEDYDKLDEEKRKQYVSIIIAESERLSNMSNNVLLLSKLENQQRMPNVTRVSLDEHLRRCIILIEKLWSAKELNLELMLDSIYYDCDEELFSHMWINILSNAIKFTPNGGDIFVGCSQTKDGIQVTIKDTGIGMTEDEVEKAFDKFYQADTSRETRGNGLGLTLVKRIAQLAGATINVESKKNHGTSFTVVLPLQ